MVTEEFKSKFINEYKLCQEKDYLSKELSIILDEYVSLYLKKHKELKGNLRIKGRILLENKLHREWSQMKSDSIDDVLLKYKRILDSTSKSIQILMEDLKGKSFKKI